MKRFFEIILEIEKKLKYELLFSFAIYLIIGLIANFKSKESVFDLIVYRHLYFINIFPFPYYWWIAHICAIVELILAIHVLAVFMAIIKDFRIWNDIRNYFRK